MATWQQPSLNSPSATTLCRVQGACNMRSVRIYIPGQYGAKIRVLAFHNLRSLYLEGHRVKQAMLRAWHLAGEPK